MRSLVLLLALLGTVASSAACRSVYYDVWETFGREKRDLLRAEVAGMVGDQEAAEEAFTDALTRMREIADFDGGALEAEYDRLRDAHDAAAAAAADIDARMDDIETVAGDLFVEWERELGTMTTPRLRDASRRRLEESRRRYDVLQRNLERTRTTMDPVLALLHDHVLYLKHNLNAAAVGALGTEMGRIEHDIGDLKASIRRSIDEAQGFLATLQ